MHLIGISFPYSVRCCCSEGGRNTVRMAPHFPSDISKWGKGAYTGGKRLFRKNKSNGEFFLSRISPNGVNSEGFFSIAAFFVPLFKVKLFYCHELNLNCLFPPFSPHADKDMCPVFSCSKNHLFSGAE